jgi:dihydroneopterin triphosphate diphosphatase
MAKKKLIDLYPYRQKDGSPEFLLLRRSAGHIYEGQWRMIGGKVKENEYYWQAALRELKEETGLIPELFWAIPSINRFYEPETDQIHAVPAFAARISLDAEITLDNEHSEFEWFRIEKAIKMILWPEQQRLLQLTDHILTSNQILDDWLVSIY